MCRPYPPLTVVWPSQHRAQDNVPVKTNNVHWKKKKKFDEPCITTLKCFLLQRLLGVYIQLCNDANDTNLTNWITLWNGNCSVSDQKTHPSHELFTLLPSGRRYKSLRCRTSRLRNSFFPSAFSLLNLEPKILNTLILFTITLNLI